MDLITNLNHHSIPQPYGYTFEDAAMISRRAVYRLRHFSVSSSSSTSSALTDASPQQHANTTLSNNHQGAPSSLTTNNPPSWLNRVLYVFDQESGTHEILQLKNKVNESSAAFDDAQRKVATARTKLDKALQTYEESQAQHNQLLQTRDKWAPSQALEFAKLLEKESTIRNEMELAKKNLSLLESQQAGSMHTYMNQLRSRYQEEQLCGRINGGYILHT